MNSPAGPCEWCGGPQHWTIIAGEMYVSCDGGCLPLGLEGLAPPSDSEELVRPEETPKMEPSEEEGVGPYEGGDARVNGKHGEFLGEVVTREFLDTLWEGGPYYGEI